MASAACYDFAPSPLFDPKRPKKPVATRENIGQFAEPTDPAAPTLSDA